MARTRRERVEAREGEIVAAASHLFAERDIDDVTVGEIGRRAGVAEGTVYLYFESKAALVQAVVVAFYERLTAHAADGVRRIRDTRKRLEFLAEHHVTNVIEHRHILFAVPRKRLDDGDGNEYRLNRTYVAVFDDVIREGVDRGEIRADVPTWLLRDIFYGSLEYAARTTMIHGRAQDARRAVQGLLQALEDGIMTSPTRAFDADGTVENVAARLERVAERLEASVPATGSRKAKL
jgi:TetR/AcrR family fatty acid metabolism transcriptional regulator